MPFWPALCAGNKNGLQSRTKATELLENSGGSGMGRRWGERWRGTWAYKVHFQIDTGALHFHILARSAPADWRGRWREEGVLPFWIFFLIPSTSSCSQWPPLVRRVSTEGGYFWLTTSPCCQSHSSDGAKAGRLILRPFKAPTNTWQSHLPIPTICEFATSTAGDTLWGCVRKGVRHKTRPNQTVKLPAVETLCSKRAAQSTIARIKKRPSTPRLQTWRHFASTSRMSSVRSNKGRKPFLWLLFYTFRTQHTRRMNSVISQ